MLDAYVLLRPIIWIVFVDSMVGLVKLSAVVGAIISIPVIIRLKSIVGSAMLLMMGISLMYICLPFMGLKDGIYILFIVITGIGFGIGFVDISMNAQGVLVEKAFLKSKLGLFHSIYCLGALGGALIGGGLLLIDIEYYYILLIYDGIFIFPSIFYSQYLYHYETEKKLNESLDVSKKIQISVSGQSDCEDNRKSTDTKNQANIESATDESGDHECLDHSMISREHNLFSFTNPSKHGDYDIVGTSPEQLSTCISHESTYQEAPQQLSIEDTEDIKIDIVGISTLGSSISSPDESQGHLQGPENYHSNGNICSIEKESDHVAHDIKNTEDNVLSGESSSFIMWLCVLGCVNNICIGSIADWSAIYLAEKFNASTLVRTLGFVFAQLMIAFGRFYSDYLFTKYKRHNVMQVSGLGCMAGLTIIIISPSFPNIVGKVIVIFGYGVTGLFTSPVYPMVISIAGNRKIKNMQSTKAIAIVALVSYLGTLLGPPFIGIISDAAGDLRYAFTVECILMSTIITLPTYLGSKLD